MKKNICVLCKKESLLTDEHLFPLALGAKIKFKILCKRCNSDLGASIDAAYISEKPIEFARTIFQIRGRAKSHPQALSGVHTVKTEDGEIKIRFDENFKPRILGSKPKIELNPGQGYTFEMSVDAKNRDQLPAQIRTSLIRFFKGKGGSLNWSQAKQEAAIKKTIDDAFAQPITRHPIQELVKAQFNLDPTHALLENLKVIYELACVSYGEDFFRSSQAKMMRIILKKRIKNGTMSLQSLESCFKKIPITSSLPPVLADLFTFVANGEKHKFLIALVAPNFVAVEMLGVLRSCFIAGTSYVQVEDLMLYLVDIERKHSTVEPLSTFFDKRA